MVLIKKFFNMQRFIVCLCITLLVPYIPITQKVVSDALWLGFPYKFYVIHAYEKFSTHFSIGTFFLNIFIIYLIYTLILIIANKIKTAIKRRVHNEKYD